MAIDRSEGHLYRGLAYLVRASSYLVTTSFPRSATSASAAPSHDERRQYQERPPRFEYRLTEKGLELYPVLVAIVRWGDRWKSDDKAPVRLVHKLCDHDADPRFVCGHCGEDLAARDVRAEPGPGLTSVAA